MFLPVYGSYEFTCGVICWSVKCDRNICWSATIKTLNIFKILLKSHSLALHSRNLGPLFGQTIKIVPSSTFYPVEPSAKSITLDRCKDR